MFEYLLGKTSKRKEIRKHLRIENYFFLNRLDKLTTTLSANKLISNDIITEETLDQFSYHLYKVKDISSEKLARSIIQLNEELGGTEVNIDDFQPTFFKTKEEGKVCRVCGYFFNNEEAEKVSSCPKCNNSKIQINTQGLYYKESLNEKLDEIQQEYKITYSDIFRVLILSFLIEKDEFTKQAVANMENVKVIEELHELEEYYTDEVTDHFDYNCIVGKEFSKDELKKVFQNEERRTKKDIVSDLEFILAKKNLIRVSYNGEFFSKDQKVQRGTFKGFITDISLEYMGRYIECFIVLSSVRDGIIKKFNIKEVIKIDG